MGTRSKMGVNDRCTRRQPLNGQQFSDDLAVMSYPRQYPRDIRRAAKARLRRHARYIQKHIPKADRSSVQQAFLDAAGRWL